MDVQAQLNKRLSDRYAIEREIGAGGMATVYLARDLKHNRKVALKVLRAELGAVLGPERFLSEIQVTANLQHPHLLPLFDSGEADGLLFYVMPFVEGESLRDRLDRERQLPVDEVLRIVSAIASALDYAHRHNVIHRDLKPENVLLHDGQPIVADFGIALAVSVAGGARVTQTGLSLGTPQYMSPEQATGDRVLDSRTDIYSLGAVAYEMLVGDPPHLGSTAQAIIAKVLTERPPSIRSARPSVPERVDAAIGRALEKLPADRWATAHEFADVLSGKTGWTGPAASVAGTATPRSRAMRALPWLVAAAGVAFAVMERVRRAPSAATAPVVTRAFVPLPDSTLLLDGGNVAISADGRTIAFVANVGGIGRRLYVRSADGLESRPVTAPIPGMHRPALSPDGSGVVFITRDSVLKSTPLDSAPTLLVRLTLKPGVPLLEPLHWGRDGQIVIASGRVLFRVPAAGGAPDTLLTYPADGPVIYLGRPRMLPDGRAVLFTAFVATNDSGGRANEIRVLDVASRGVSTVVSGGNADYVEPGFLIYAAGGQGVVAQAFNPRTRKVSGPTVVLASRAFDRALSPNGVGVLAERRAAAAQLFAVTGGGAPVALPIPGGAIRSVRFDREGRRLLYGREPEVFVADLALGTNTMILPRTWAGYEPIWSPGERSVTFHENWAFAGPGAPRPTLGWDGFEMSADGTGNPRQIFRDASAGAPAAWLPDGKLLSRGSPGGNSDLFLHTLSGDTATSVPWLHAAWDERGAMASPDGRFIAFVSTESGHDEVTVRPYPDPSVGKWVISEGAADDPVWSRDGETLYYWEGPALRAARLRTSPTFAVLSRETVLTDAAYHRECCLPNYDLSPDGKRIILARRVGDARVSGFVLVTNWGEEIRQKLAAAGRQ